MNRYLNGYVPYWTSRVEGRKDACFKLCEDIAMVCVVIDYANKSIYSLHPTKQDV